MLRHYLFPWFDASVSADVLSPCVKVCEFDSSIGLCRGCYRDLDEITLWSQWSLVQKQRVLDRLDARRLRFQPADPA